MTPLQLTFESHYKRKSPRSRHSELDVWAIISATPQLHGVEAWMRTQHTMDRRSRSFFQERAPPPQEARSPPQNVDTRRTTTLSWARLQRAMLWPPVVLQHNHFATPRMVICGCSFPLRRPMHAARPAQPLRPGRNAE